MKDHAREKRNLLILGAHGMVGSALNRKAMALGVDRVLAPSSAELNLCCQADTQAYLREHRPAEVVVAAAKVGGIFANEAYPAEFIYQNLMIASNVIEGAYQAGVPRLLFLGSSCIYPKLAKQPITEDSLLGGFLEPTNEPYAVAKIAGMKLCQYYRKQYGVLYHSVMPTNLYGPGDNYHPENSHVIPALLRRFHVAVQEGVDRVVLWGSGKPRREFLHVDDLAEACFQVLAIAEPADCYNVGFGTDITIRELATLVAEVVGFTGQIDSDLSKPDGTPRKLLDSSRLLATGWSPSISLRDGLQQTYEEFLAREAEGVNRQL